MEKEYPIDDEYCSIFKKSEELYPIYKVMEEKGYIINMRGELRLNTGNKMEAKDIFTRGKTRIY